MNLASDPWIPVLTTGGMDTLSLRDTLERSDTVVDVATGDTLEDAAIMRLILACALAARGSRLTPADWVGTQRDRFDLFDPSAPFAQNPDMARFADDPKSMRPIASTSYSLVGNGSTAAGDTHNEAGIRLTPARAARVLLVRQMFSVGGIQPFTAAAYGKSPMSAKSAVHTNRPLLWIQGHTLTETLTLTLAGTGSPAGIFHFTWPDRATPADVGTPDGVLDALTWPSRSMLLLRDEDGLVDRAMLCDGLRWPDVDQGTWTAADEQRCFPFTTYAKKKPAEPFSIQDVHVDRTVWRQLLTAWSDDEQPGILAATTGTGILRLSGLGSYQSRIDGAVTGTLPVPSFDRRSGRTLSTAIANAYKTIASVNGSLTHNMLTSSTESWSKAATGTAIAGFADTFELIIATAATGEITVDEACAALAEHAATTAHALITATARVRPVAAARTASRPAIERTPR